MAKEVQPIELAPEELEELQPVILSVQDEGDEIEEGENAVPSED